MHAWAVFLQTSQAGALALSGIQLRRVLSADLFRESAGVAQYATSPTVADLCHDRWTELASALAAVPEVIEGIVVLGKRSIADQSPAGVEVEIACLAVGRGDTAAQAEAQCTGACDNLWTLLLTNLDYAELQPVEDVDRLKQIVTHLQSPYVTEVRRRLEKIQVSHGSMEREPLGFGDRQFHQPEWKEGADMHLVHLFPWVPSDDTWRRLLEVLDHESGDAALVVHFRGWERAPILCLDAARAALASAEKIAAYHFDEAHQHIDIVLQLQADALRQEALRRLAIVEGRVLAGQVFLSTSQPPSAALIATVCCSIDDASVQPNQIGTESIFRGGASVSPGSAEAVLTPLDTPSLDLLFGVREASAILRTPMPTEMELPGLPINRARTAALVGRSGDDCPLGSNIHRGLQLAVALENPMRFRHTYIIGQTGTGKSTLLLHMILHDIRQGRGVAVIDPHGSLIDDLLLRFPQERKMTDVIIVDVTDVEQPVGFNVLRIEEQDPLQYRLARDLIIDDLYSYLDRTYDMKQTGGPIFETHFRGMLALLLGLEPQVSPYIPNLMIFRSLYTNETLREALVNRNKGKDDVLDDFIDEALNTKGEGSLSNLAPYITSKFNRFISDLTLRNMTCQNAMLNLDQVVNEGKVLLFNLGKGRFGDQAAGLLASQVVSRIRHSVMKQGAGSALRPFYLYIDEFQLLADERLAELLAEARKFRLALTMAHQYLRQIPETILPALLGTVGTTIVFRAGMMDSQLLEPVFSPTFSQRDIVSLSNFRAYVRSVGVLGSLPFSVEIPPPPSLVDPETALIIRALARKTYGRSRERVEREIQKTYRAYANYDKDSEALSDMMLSPDDDEGARH